MEKVTFAAGCFWGVEQAFREIDGVAETRAGYTGGDFDNPAYQDVCAGRTGHAEAVEVTFDPARVTLDDLLALFWKIHDPTTPNRQGPDIGSQYRSAIFTHSDEQAQAARASAESLAESGRLGGRPIVTQIVPATTFWPAEDSHQRYFEKRGGGSCHIPAGH